MNSENMEMSIHHKDYKFFHITYPSMSFTLLKHLEKNKYISSLGESFELKLYNPSEEIRPSEIKEYVFKIEDMDKIMNKYSKILTEDILYHIDHELLILSTTCENLITLAGIRKDSDILDGVKLDLSMFRKKLEYTREYHNFINNRIPASKASKYKGKSITVLTVSGTFADAIIDNDGNITFNDWEEVTPVRYFVLKK